MSRGQRRALRWYAFQTLHQLTSAGPNVNVHDVLLNVIDPAYVDCTIVRIRGRVRAQVSASFNADDISLLGLGLMVATAGTLTASDAPKPLDAATSADWMWHDYLLMGDSATDPSADDMLVIDNKSKRIMHQANKSLYLVTQSGGPATIRYTVGLRVLCMI